MHAKALAQTRAQAGEVARAVPDGVQTDDRVAVAVVVVRQPHAVDDASRAPPAPRRVRRARTGARGVAPQRREAAPRGLQRMHRHPLSLRRFTPLVISVSLSIGAGQAAIGAACPSHRRTPSACPAAPTALRGARAAARHAGADARAAARRSRGRVQSRRLSRHRLQPLGPRRRVRAGDVLQALSPTSARSSSPLTRIG